MIPRASIRQDTVLWTPRDSGNNPLRTTIYAPGDPAIPAGAPPAPAYFKFWGRDHSVTSRDWPVSNATLFQLSGHGIHDPNCPSAAHVNLALAPNITTSTNPDLWAGWNARRGNWSLSPGGATTWTPWTMTATLNAANITSIKQLNILPSQQNSDTCTWWIANTLVRIV